jgi:hypothetical protein
LQPIRAEFTTTYDDLKEALRANGTLQVTFWTFGWCVTIGLLLGLVGRSQLLVPDHWPRNLPVSLLRLFVVFAPGLLAIGLFVASSLRQMRNLKNPRPIGRAYAWGGWIGAAVLAPAHVYLARRLAEPAVALGVRTEAAAVLRELTPVIVWVSVYFLFAFAALWYSRGSMRRVWTADVTLHRPKRFEAGANGVTFADALSRHEETWPALLDARETANLFLLYVGRSKFYILPKRGFSDAAALDAFRAALRQGVSEVARAFPVGPPPPPPNAITSAVPPPLPRPVLAHDPGGPAR